MQTIFWLEEMYLKVRSSIVNIGVTQCYINPINLMYINIASIV